MSRWFFRVCAAVAALALLASPIFAVGPGGGPVQEPPGGGGQNPGPTPPSQADVPEINPGAAVGALVLLAGSTLLLTDRLRRRHSPQTDRAA